MAMAPILTSFASPMAAGPLYISPSGGKYHQRRPSIRRTSRSYGSNPNLISLRSPSLSDPRTTCPRDTDAFSYNPKHLASWYMPQDIWEQLPVHLQACVAAVQHAGAAVLTSFERLESMKPNPLLAAILQAEAAESITTSSAIEEDEAASSTTTKPLTPALEALRRDSAISLSSHPATHSTISCSASVHVVFPTTTTSADLHSSPSPSHSPPTPSTPTSPLPPPILDPTTNPTKDLNGSSSGSGNPTTRRHHARSFTAPLPPPSAYYAAELSALRADALVRLRHAARRLSAEWAELRRSYGGVRCSYGGVRCCCRPPPSLSPSPHHHHAAGESGSELEGGDEAFERWWRAKRERAALLDAVGRRLSEGEGVRGMEGWGVGVRGLEGEDEVDEESGRGGD